MKSKSNKKTIATKPPTKFGNSGNNAKVFYSTNSNLIHYVILFSGAILLYGWTSTFNFGLDDSYILNILKPIDNNFNGMILTFSQKFGGWDYRPVSVLSFWIERFLFGSLNPGISHFINTVIFGFLLTLVYRFIIICRFYEDTQKLRVLALLTGIIFLIHPNHVSVVANIKSRDSLLSMSFGLMSAIQFLKLAEDKKWIRILLIVLFLFLGFLSKMDCYIFAFIPGLVVIIFRKTNSKKMIFILLVSFSLLILIFNFKDYLFSNLVVQSDLPRTILDSPLANNDSFINRISMSCITMLYYLKFLIVPWGYYYFFGYNQIPLLPLFHPVNFLAVFLFLSMGIACIYYYKRNRIYLFSFLFFLLGIVYASNLVVVVAGILMDRYNFIPSFGFCLVLAALMLDLTGVNDRAIFKNKWVISILVIFCIFTMYRTSAWKDKLTLFNRDIGHLDKSANALLIISATYINAVLFELKDKELSDRYMSLAEQYIDRSLKITDKIPSAWEAKGICELYKGDSRSALEKFRKCMDLDSNHLSGINYMGVAFRNMNMTDSAYYYFHLVMERENDFGYSADNLVQLLINNNRQYEADSIINVLHQRFPNDKNLNKKMEEWKPQKEFHTLPSTIQQPAF